MNKHFSIMISARHRPNNLEACLRTLFETSNEPDLLEVRIALDLDDTLLLKIVPLIIKDLRRDNIFIHTRNRGNNYVRDYTNWLALNFCTGDYLFNVSDKSQFKIKNWDTNVYNRLEEYLKDKPDRIVYGCTGCEEVEKDNFKMAYFPIVSKQVIKAFGYMYDYHFPKTGADWDLAKTFNKFGRVVDLRDICRIENHNDEIMNNTYEQLGLDTIPNLEDYQAHAGQYIEEHITKLNNYIRSFDE